MASRASFIGAIAIALLVALALMSPRLFERSSATSAPAPAEPSAVVAAAPPPLLAPPPPTAPRSLPPHAALDPKSGELCPRAMAFVEGRYCPYVAHRCALRLGAEALRRDPRCSRFEDDLICDGRPMALSFCIDLFEYPNLEGVLPATMVDYRDAERACAAEGKRLCEAEEWIFACEGSRTFPYPTGLSRDASACNIDRVPRRPSAEALARSFDVSVEIARLDQRMHAGASPACASPFGVFDTTGNVAEWVHDREGKRHLAPFTTALAGGHWERDAVATCRGLERAHPASYRDHRTGFRCCKNAGDGRPARRLLPREVRLPRRRKVLP